MKRTIAMVVVLTINHGIAAAFALPQSATESSARAPETPTQLYVRYRQAVLDATSMDDVLKFWRAKLVSEYKQAPPEERADLFGVKRVYGRVSDVRVTDETVGASGATLSLSGVGPQQKQITGTAYLVMEDGHWKLFGQEAWNWN